jgi:hypothetical protein
MQKVIIQWWNEIGKRSDKGCGSGARLDLVNVGLSWTLVRRCEKRIDLAVFGKPSGHLAKLFAEAVYSLIIHVRLRDELGH